MREKVRFRMTETTGSKRSAAIVGEHRLQLDMLAAIRKAISDKSGREEVDTLLERLAEYTEIHFASEQMLMRLYAYPAYQGHVDEHDRTLTWLDTLRVTWRGGDGELAIDTANELTQWIEGHMRRADRAFETYLDGLGGPAGPAA